MRVRKRENEETLSGAVILWTEREHTEPTISEAGRAYPKVPVRYPCCGRIGKVHQASLARYRKADPIHCDVCAKETQKGKAHHHWKGGYHTHRGYRYVHVDHLPEEQRPVALAMLRHGRYVPEHRLLVALREGRPLTSSEHVHHINGVKDDNRLDNLVLLTESEHSVEHHAVEKALALALAKIKTLEEELACCTCRLR